MSQAATLEAFGRALRREVHVLRGRPELTWQQLYNRLQWEAEEVGARLAPELERRIEPGRSPWLRFRAPPRESSNLIRTMGGDAGPSTGCAVAPDASFILSTSADGPMRMWDPETGKVQREFEGIGAPFALSPEGKRLLANAHVWDLATGEAQFRLRGKFFYWGPCTWVPGAPLLVSAGGQVVSVWDANTGRSVRTLSGRLSNMRSCAVSPDGSLILAAGGRSIKIWDTETGEPVATLRAGKQAVFDCAISPDGESLASSGDDGLRLWEVGRWEERGRMGGALERYELARPCAFSPDGRLVAAGERESTIRVWDVETQEEVTMLEGHTGRIIDCAFSPDGSFFVSAGADGTVRLWSLGAAGADGASTRAMASPTGVRPEQSFAYPASGGGRRRSTFKGIETGVNVPRIDRYTGGVLWDLISANRSALVGGSRDGPLLTLRVWDPGTAGERCSIDVPGGWLGNAAVSPESSFIATYGGIGKRVIVLWDAHTGHPVRILTGNPEEVCACAIGPDGSFLVAGSRAGSLTVWDVEAGESRRTMSLHPGPVTVCALSPDGSFGVSVGTEERGDLQTANERTIRVWDVASAREYTLSGHAGPVSSCTISPDASLIFSVGEDRSLRVWQARTGEPVAILPVPDGRATLWAHPWAPVVTCELGRASAYVVDLLGIEYGPLAVTAIDMGEGAKVRCPACGATFRTQGGSLSGQPGIACPECTAVLRLSGISRPWAAHAPRLTAAKTDCEPVRQFVRRAFEASIPGGDVRAEVRREQALLSAIDWIEANIAVGRRPAYERPSDWRAVDATPEQLDLVAAHLIICPDCGVDTTWLTGEAKPQARRRAGQRPAKRDAGRGRLRGLLRRRAGRS